MKALLLRLSYCCVHRCHCAIKCVTVTSHTQSLFTFVAATNATALSIDHLSHYPRHISVTRHHCHTGVTLCSCHASATLCHYDAIVTLHHCNTSVNSATVTLVTLYHIHTSVTLHRCHTSDTLNDCHTGVNLHDCNTSVTLHHYHTSASSYVDILRNTQIRKDFIKFCISNHNLCIEVWRYCKPKVPREEQLCKVCV